MARFGGPFYLSRATGFNRIGCGAEEYPQKNPPMAGFFGCIK
jgi:hypothetical protein